MTSILDLPEEILLQVFGLLPPSDLKTIVLVSKQWMVLGEDPNLWTWATVSVNIKEDLLKLKKRRLQKLKKVKVTNWFDGSQSVLMQHKTVFSGLASVFARWFGLIDDSTQVKPEDLFEALLPITTLTSIDGLMFDGSDVERNVKTFIEYGVYTYHPDLSGIEPEVFARVISRLSYLSLEEINPITSPQYEALLSVIASRESHVKDLVFGIQPIPVQPDVFATAVNNVEVCDFGIFCVPSQHMQALCVAVAEEQGQLKMLKVFSAFLSSIDPTILGTAISRLESVCIYQESDLLSKEQIQVILRKAGEDGSQLKRLQIVMREEQKEELDQDVLRQAGQKIGVLEWTTLSTEMAAHGSILTEHVLTICAKALEFKYHVWG